MENGKIAFVFSGQGAQATGMGKELCETSETAAKIFAMADEIRPGTSLQCFSAPKEELDITINTQPCLFTVDLAAAKAVEEIGVHADAVAGFSLGEIAALGFAGVFAEDEAFKLVCERANYMQEAAEANPGAMGAVLGMDSETLENVLKGFDKAQAVNFNCPGQIVVAAKAENIDEIQAAVSEKGGKFRRLAVSGAFHSSFMEGAAEKLANYLENTMPVKSRIPVYANLTAQPYSDDAAEMRSTASKQVCNAVRWQETIENMIKDGVNTFIEVGEGKVLCGLIRKINKEVKALHYTQVLADKGV